MPTGSPSEHEYWCSKDEDGDGDFAAQKHLKDAGYTLTRKWEWTKPTPDHVPTAEERRASQYLIDEWDFGGIDT